MTFDLRTAIAGVAPTLAAMLGGPLAGSALTALEVAFGLAPGAGANAITQVLQSGGATPEIMAATRKADQEHADRLAQMDIDVQKLNLAHAEALASADVQDRGSARAMQVSAKSYLVPTLALTIVGAFICMVALSLLGMSKTDSALAGTLIGYLSAKAEQVVAFYFGSSAGSQRKDELLAQAPAIGSENGK